jgi:hypothetical protein
MMNKLELAQGLCNAQSTDPNTDPAKLTELASDKDWHVRYNVASNPSAPREGLEILLLDPEIYDRMIDTLINRKIKNDEQTSTIH